MSHPACQHAQDTQICQGEFFKGSANRFGGTLIIRIWIEFRFIENSENCFLSNFCFFQKDGISDNEMLERNQRPEKGKMLIQVKSPKGPSAFVSAARRSEFTRHIRALGLNYRHSPSKKSV